MKKELLIIFICFGIISCKKHETSEFVIISGISNVKLDTIRLQTHSRFYLNSQKKESFNIIVGSDYNFLDTLKISKGYYELIVGNKTIPLYLKQGFNISMDLTKPNTIINGTGEIENRYLQEKKELDYNLASINYYQYFSFLKEVKFLKFADSIKILRDNLIKSYKLPEGQFKFIEESYSTLDRTNKFLKYPFTRKEIDLDYVPSKNYPDIYSGLNIDDERLIELPLFKILMFTKVLTKNELQSNTDSDESLSSLRIAISDELEITNRVVKEQLVFTTADWKIEGTDSLDTFYNTFKKFNTNEDYLKKITSKYLKMKGIVNGSQAPNFEFYNNKDELVSLESLKGYVVYLDIWATYCKPCIKEMEPSNKLQQKLSDKKIKFLSVCIESKRESWFRLIKEKGYKGTQLFCTKDDEDIFKQNYLVEALPRYLIIDKNGEVHDFQAKRPSNTELESELLNIL